MGKTSAAKRALQGRVAKAKEKKQPPKLSPSGKENKASKGKKRASKAVAEKKKPVVPWAKPEYHEYTDKLLTIIEEKNRYRQAFGFEKEPGSIVTTGGQTIKDLHFEVAESLFLGDPGFDFTTDDLPDLAKVVSNRIASLKKSFRTQRDRLGETGQGLLNEDREDEIAAGSALANVWDSVLKKMPWYRRLHKLMGSSPAVDRSAIANSETELDLTALDTSSSLSVGKRSRKKLKVVQDVSDDEDTTNGDNGSEEEDGDENASGDEDKDTDNSSDNEDTSVASDFGDPVSPSSNKRKRVSPKAEMPVLSTPSSQPKGRQGITDKISKMAEEDRTHRLAALKVREKEKTARNQSKADVRREIELKKLEHQEREAERQREHEVRMFELQARSHPPPPMWGPPTGAPPPFHHYPAGPSAPVFDPSLL